MSDTLEIPLASKEEVAAFTLSSGWMLNLLSVVEGEAGPSTPNSDCPPNSFEGTQESGACVRNCSARPRAQYPLDEDDVVARVVRRVEASQHDVPLQPTGAHAVHHCPGDVVRSPGSDVGP